MRNASLTDLGVDRSWTLFLDRDGVINRRRDDYVKSWAEVEILPGVLEAFAHLSRVFGAIVVLTNQRCIARGLTTQAAVDEVHARLRAEIVQSGGTLDAVYVCPHETAAGCGCRKPNVGLALRAQRDRPGVEFARSVMVGDARSDIELGRRLNMVTVIIGEGLACAPPIAADFRCADLAAFAHALCGDGLNPILPPRL